MEAATVNFSFYEHENFKEELGGGEGLYLSFQ